MGCCGGRGCSIFAAIYSLVQGSAWLGLAITGLLVYQCKNTLTYDLSDWSSSDVLTTISGFFMDMLTLYYFYNNDCEENKRPNIKIDVNGVQIAANWSIKNEPPVETTYTWMLTYTILSSVWIAASILLLIVAVSNKKSKTAALLHYPWIITMAAILVADVVATVIYILDISKTTGIENGLTFAGLQDLGEYGSYLPPMEPQILSAIPSIVMAVIFSRGVIFWIINLVVFISVLQSAIRIGKQKNEPKMQKTIPIQPPVQHTAPWMNGNVRETYPGQHAQQRQLRFQDQEPPPTMPKSLRPQSQPQQQIYPQQTSQQYPQQQNRYFQTSENYYLSPNVAPQQGYNNKAYVYSDPAIRTPKEPVYYELKPQILIQREPVRNSKVGPSTMPKPTQAGPLRRTDSNSVQAELRSQLPWSYMQPRDEPINVKVQKIDEEGHDAPPIPIPDYTLHFPKRPRGDNPMFDPSTSPTKVSKGYDVFY